MTWRSLLYGALDPASILGAGTAGRRPGALPGAARRGHQLWRRLAAADPGKSGGGGRDKPSRASPGGALRTSSRLFLHKPTSADQRVPREFRGVPISSDASAVAPLRRDVIVGLGRASRGRIGVPMGHLGMGAASGSRPHRFVEGVRLPRILFVILVSRAGRGLMNSLSPRAQGGGVSPASARPVLSRKEKEFVRGPGAGRDSGA